MKQTRTPSGEALTNLMLDLFRTNSLILSSGDRLVSPLGLTSARWQVLGAIAAAGRPQPVAWLARDLGVNRQNVQRIVTDLKQDELVRMEPNPHHRRAQLVVLTAKGSAALDAAMALQTPWVNNLSEGLTESDLETMHEVLVTMRNRLEREKENGGPK